MKRHNRGISLLELVATVAIIVALAGIIMPAVSIMKNNTRQAEASGEIAQLDTALIAFFTDNGCYPRTGQMLASLSDKYFNFDAERVEGNSYNDPWGKPYLYISPAVISSKGYDLYSVGLLLSKGNVAQLSKILAASSSSNITSDSEKEIKIGEPKGQGEETIWGLTEPEYDMLIKAALSLLRSTDVGYELAAKINISNIVIEWADLSGTGYLAYYWPYSTCQDRGIYIDISLSDGPAEAIAALLAHEATHLADHLASGDMDFDSIEEEYDAFYNEAMVWEALKGNKTDAVQDDILSIVKQGEDAARAWIRGNYPEWPEEDQWGDSYVVAKEY